MGVSAFNYSLPATEYGKIMEKMALAQYSLKHDNEHTNSEFLNVVFSSARNTHSLVLPLMAYSNVVVVVKGLLRLNARMPNLHLSPDEVQCDKYNMCLEDGSVKLKRDIKRYTQIQTQLGVTKNSWCDFVFTREGLSVERIEFDSEYFKHCQSKAKAFFFKFLKDKLY